MRFFYLADDRQYRYERFLGEISLISCGQEQLQSRPLPLLLIFVRTLEQEGPNFLGMFSCQGVL